MRLADARRLKGRIARARERHASPEQWAALAAEVAAATARHAARVASRPAFAYPPELPVSARAADIAAAIRAHPVVIVCGETGSGKTTQLPKICIDAGRGARGLIGHTQPRRIAARAVASRIAQEMETPLGEAVGYKVRFTDRTQARCLGQADDRRHPARGDPARPLAVRLRHDHRRRGARAQPQHRLPAGLPRAPRAAPPRPARGDHLRDDRRRALRPALRQRGPAGAGDRGVGPHVSGRGALPAARRRGDRRRGSRRRGGARGRDRGDRRGPLARRARRHPRVPARRARDPRDRRPAAHGPRAPAVRGCGRGAAALCAAVGGGPAARVRAVLRPPRRARDQRRRDLDHRAGHPLRDRLRPRPRQALQPAQQDDAALARKGVEGRGEPARRPLRPRRRRHLRAPLRRSRLRGARPTTPTRRSCAARSPR